MTYKELIEFTKKHPNPFWNREQHNKEAEYKFRTWLKKENLQYDEEKKKKSVRQ